jgi:hypothetical protein
VGYAVLTSLGWDEQDFLSTRSFWQLRGTVDATGPSVISSLLTCCFVLGLAWQGRRLAQTHDAARALRFAGASLGAVACLAIQAWIVLHTTVALNSNSSFGALTLPLLPGPMLAGFFVSLATLGWLGWKGQVLKFLELTPRITLTVLVIVPAAIQLTTLARYLNRLY